ncbi:hypothetical protein [Streptomyces pseudoechinosporeus]
MAFTSRVDVVLSPLRRAEPAWIDIPAHILSAGHTGARHRAPAPSARRDLAAFYIRCGYTTHAPGETVSLNRIGLPFSLGAGDDQCIFTRWRPHR